MTKRSKDKAVRGIMSRIRMLDVEIKRARNDNKKLVVLLNAKIDLLLLYGECLRGGDVN